MPLKIFIPLLAAVFAVSGPIEAGALLNESLLREGDIIFHESRSEQARAIKLATGSRYTHVGILIRYAGRMKVLEAVQPVISPASMFNSPLLITVYER